jgi:hypothetical protein
MHQSCFQSTVTLSNCCRFAMRMIRSGIRQTPARQRSASPWTFITTVKWARYARGCLILCGSIIIRHHRPSADASLGGPPLSTQRTSKCGDSYGQQHLHDRMATQFYYPFVYVMPSGHLFILIDRVSRVITEEGEWGRRASNLVASFCTIGPLHDPDVGFRIHHACRGLR